MIKPADFQDLHALAELAALLWPHHTADDLAAEFSELMSCGHVQFFLKSAQGVPVGFAQCQLRHDYVEGTDTSPVGYLEGIFVRVEHRHKGYARELLSACEAWAKRKGCREFASDCELHNEASLAFHRKVGFGEVSRIICFTKRLET